MYKVADKTTQNSNSNNRCTEEVSSAQIASAQFDVVDIGAIQSGDSKPGSSEQSFSAANHVNQVSTADLNLPGVFGLNWPSVDKITDSLKNEKIKLYTGRAIDREEIDRLCENRDEVESMRAELGANLEELSKTLRENSNMGKLNDQVTELLKSARTILNELPDWMVTIKDNVGRTSKLRSKSTDQLNATHESAAKLLDTFEELYDKAIEQEKVTRRFFKTGQLEVSGPFSLNVSMGHSDFTQYEDAFSHFAEWDDTETSLVENGASEEFTPEVEPSQAAKEATEESPADRALRKLKMRRQVNSEEQAKNEEAEAEDLVNKDDALTDGLRPLEDELEEVREPEQNINEEAIPSDVNDEELKELLSEEELDDGRQLTGEAEAETDPESSQQRVYSAKDISSLIDEQSSGTLTEIEQMEKEHDEIAKELDELEEYMQLSWMKRVKWNLTWNGKSPYWNDTVSVEYRIKERKAELESLSSRIDEAERMIQRQFSNLSFMNDGKCPPALLRISLPTEKLGNLPDIEEIRATLDLPPGKNPITKTRDVLIQGKADHNTIEQLEIRPEKNGRYILILGGQLLDATPPRTENVGIWYADEALKVARAFMNGHALKPRPVKFTQFTIIPDDYYLYEEDNGNA